MSDRGKAEFTTMDMGDFGNTESNSSYSPGEMLNKGFSELDDSLVVKGSTSLMKKPFQRTGDTIARSVQKPSALPRRDRYVYGELDDKELDRLREVLRTGSGKKEMSEDVVVKERGEARFKLGEQIKCSSGYKIKTKGLLRDAAIVGGSALMGGGVGYAAGKNRKIKDSHWDKEGAYWDGFNDAANLNNDEKEYKKIVRGSRRKYAEFKKRNEMD